MRVMEELWVLEELGVGEVWVWEELGSCCAFSYGASFGLEKSLCTPERLTHQPASVPSQMKHSLQVYTCKCHDTKKTDPSRRWNLNLQLSIQQLVYRSGFCYSE